MKCQWKGWRLASSCSGWSANCNDRCLPVSSRHPVSAEDIRTVPKKIPIPPYSPKLKNPPYSEHVIEVLQRRMREGSVTLSEEEAQQIIAMLEILSERCGGAYQVVGELASHAGRFHDPAVVKVMDVLARPLLRGE